MWLQVPEKLAMAKHRYIEDHAHGERCKVCGYPKPEDVKDTRVNHPKKIKWLTRVWECRNCGEIIGVPVPPTRLEKNK